MLEKYFNPHSSYYKWDKFWVGFLPALLLPVISFFAFYCFTWFNSVYLNKASYSFNLFLYTMYNPAYFLKTSTLCCLPNGAVFFFFIQRDYYNSSRAVLFTTMFYIIAIVIADMI